MIRRKTSHIEIALFVCVCQFFWAGSRLDASPKLALPKTAFDGGVVSAETLARGGAMVSNMGTLGSGSENPATLYNPNNPSSFYITMLPHFKSNLPDSVVRSLDPLNNRVLQYLSMGAEKGVLYFEPLARIDRRDPLNPAVPDGDYRDTKLQADAIGFAGAEKFGRNGSIGMSLAFLNAHMAGADVMEFSPDETRLDSGNGFRLNLGVRYPTGPVMWGLVAQNFPAYIFWKNHKREILPVKIRAGQTWQVHPGTLMSLDIEQRYYKEGGSRDTFYYLGNETYMGEQIILRLGTFTNQLNASEAFHWTGGLTLLFGNDVELTVAHERFKEILSMERISRTLVSLKIPFVTN